MRELVLREDQRMALAPLPAFWDDIEVISSEGATWFTGVPAWPRKLRTLSLEDVPNLLSVPPWPATLETLQLGGASQLRTLPALPEQLRELALIVCEALEAVPALPVGLERLALVELPRLTRLPPLSPTLRDVRFEACPYLELNSEQVDFVDALRWRQKRFQPGFMVRGFAGSGGVCENLCSPDLDQAARRVYEFAGMSMPELEAEVWAHVADAKGAMAEPLCTLFFRMATEEASERGGVRSIARDMVGTLAVIARHPELVEYAVAVVARMEPGCVNQPVATWRHVSALAVAHEAAASANDLSAVFLAARPLLAHMAIDEAALLAIGEARRVRAEVIEQTGEGDRQCAADLLVDYEPEIPNRMAMRIDAHRQARGESPLPGVPRRVAYLSDVLEEFVDTCLPRGLAAVEAAMLPPSASVGLEIDPVRMLCRGPHADWWKEQAMRHSPAARFDLGVNGQIGAIYTRRLANLESQAEQTASTTSSKYATTAQLDAGRNLVAQRREAESSALEKHTSSLVMPVSARSASPGRA
ncbi:hypothetical protein LMG19083_04678 [Ralstonia psammae]|uniref:Uncharacterized protein n=1 Tax=Ralstonia psammae TaxID=3058598 RepID=A0ABM9JY93_9RALS|nr:hypothetical protein [Ralstonia sp. LMG 19083]CAJ0808255.1 hypothetical protein LMG19083_04678 [Ralstonia sp. LMG 19083]